MSNLYVNYNCAVDAHRCVDSLNGQKKSIIINVSAENLCDLILTASVSDVYLINVCGFVISQVHVQKEYFTDTSYVFTSYVHRTFIICVGGDECGF